MSLQTLVLFPELPSREWLHARANHKPFRAVAEFTSGRYAAMGLISQPAFHHFGPGQHTIDPGSSRVDASNLSGSSHINAKLSWAALDLPPIVLPKPIPPTPPVAGLPPLECIAMAFLRLHAGQFADFGAHVLVARDGVQVATATLIGPATFNFMVEVVGENPSDTLQAVQGMLDHTAVARADVCHTTGALTTGFGEAHG